MLNNCVWECNRRNLISSCSRILHYIIFTWYQSCQIQRKQGQEKGLHKPEASKGTQHRKKEALISMTDLDVLSSRLKEDDTCLASSVSAGIWYIDSGASAHMTGVREYFLSYREEQMNFRINMGNSTKCTLVGRGSIVFQTETGTSVRITDVLHVPRLGMNLISVS